MVFAVAEAKLSTSQVLKRKPRRDGLPRLIKSSTQFERDKHVDNNNKNIVDFA